MLLKLILSHVIFEPRYSLMIANKTLQPSCRSLKSGARRNVPLTSSLCCCSLKIKDPGLLARYYSTHGYQDGRKTRDSLGRESLKSIDNTERETFRQRLNAFVSQARKSSSIRRFEPCYRQIYPSKKRKATFKIPKKPPYIPAVYQKRTPSYRDKYEKMNLEPIKGSKLQWPPLYPSRKRDSPLPEHDKTHELPSWLLPLYSCKSCHTEGLPKTSEARFSGGAFHRKMEIMESIKQIRANQNVLLSRLHEKEAKKDETTILNARKSANLVEALKRKIDSMQEYLNAMKHMEAYRKKYQIQKIAQETEITEITKLRRQAYDRIYQTKPPTQAREVRVRKSMGLGVAGPKHLDKPLHGTSKDNIDQQLENSNEVLNNKSVPTPKRQSDEGAAQNPKVESNSSDRMAGTKYPTAETSKTCSVGEIHKESVVMIKQPSWKNHRKNNESTTNDKKTLIFSSQTNSESIPNQGRASPRQRLGKITDDTTDQQPSGIKVNDTKTEGDIKSGDAWTVESLKSRINVMKIKNTLDTPGMKEVDDISLTRNGGEIKPKISQVALRSFHKDAGMKSPRIAHMSNITSSRLGYQRNANRRNFSTLRMITPARPVTKAIARYRRNISDTPQKKRKKPNWVSRFKRCFALKKIKASKCENWKETPREIPYEREVVKQISPAPVLWKPPDSAEIREQSKPTEDVLVEKVNPAILNAEQRVLSSLSRLMPTKTQSGSQDVQFIDIEKKMRRARNKVNLMPWFKRSRSAGSLQKLPQLRGPYNSLEKDEPRESGYEWILKNRDMVEEFKRQSRYAAGKPLVPTEVKTSINQYKLPLKAEISRYRKKMDQKCTQPLYLCSTSKRWYSTCYTGIRRRILTCSDVFLVDTRGIKTTKSHKGKNNSTKFLDKTTHSDIVLGPNFRRFNQGVPFNNRNVEEHSENPEEEARLKRWSWKIPNKTRPFTPKAASLTSPNKIMGTRMSEMSPCALKKQVEELKRLIKKAKEEVAEKTDEFSIDQHSGDTYEVRLKRLVKAAHSNAHKMQIMGPKYTSENNMLTSKPSSGKKNTSQAMIQYDTNHENPKHKPEVSVLKSLFKKTKGETNSLANEILCRNNLASLPALVSKKKSEKHTSRVYLKLKSLVEAVKTKSAMLDPISDTKRLPPKSLKGSISVDAMFPLTEKTATKSGEPTETVKTEYVNEVKSPVTVELLAHRTPTPSNTIHLWKGDSKPKEFNSGMDKEPTYGDLLTLLTKAKGLFYYQPPKDDMSTDVQFQKIEIHKCPNDADIRNTVTEKEISKQWLSIREDVTNAAKAVAEQKKNEQQADEPTSQSCSYLLSSQQNPSGVNLSGCMLTKSTMAPLEGQKLDSNTACDHLWASVPVKVLEDEDLCRTFKLETKSIEENQSASQPDTENTISEPIKVGGSKTSKNQTKSLQPENGIDQQETRKPVGLESTKLLFQRPITALGSLTKNFGNGVGSLLGKSAENLKYAGPQTLVGGSNFLRSHQKEDGSNPSGEVLNSNHHELSGSNSISIQPQATAAVSDITSNCLHGSYNSQVMTHQNTAILDSSSKQTNELQNRIKEDQYVQDCIENINPLEEKVKRYENYYRHYFAEDVPSGYEHLHEVYEGLSKLNTVSQYHSFETPSQIGMETGKEASHQVINAPASTSPTKNSSEEKYTPTQVTSRAMTNLKAHESAEIHSDGQREAMKTKNDDSSNVINIVGQIPSNSKIIYETGLRENIQSNVQNKGTLSVPQNSVEGHYRNNDDVCEIKSADVIPSNEPFIDSSGNIREGAQTHKWEPVDLRTPTKLESNPVLALKDTQPFTGVNSEEQANFEELLNHDPTLNPEVVKNLKLPVILAEDSHTENNWYTKFYNSPNQNR